MRHLLVTVIMASAVLVPCPEAGAGHPAPPDTTITSGPTGVTGDATPTFTFKASKKGSKFKCKIDGHSPSRCRSPLTTAALADGPHVLAVVATKRHLKDRTAAHRAFTVDTAPPDTTIVSGPEAGSTVAVDTASFAFTGDGGTTLFRCRLDDNGIFTECTSPITYTDLAEGAHTFAVRACDAVGNCDPTAATRTWAVDTTPPDTTIDSGPTGVTVSQTATFTYSGSPPADLAVFRCSLDGAAPSPCSSQGITYSGLTLGVQHTFTVRACDALANCDPSPATRTWTVVSQTVMNETDDQLEADFCNIQFPQNGIVVPGQPFTVWGQLYEVGMTQPPGANDQVRAAVGYGPLGSDPRSSPGWTYSPAAFNLQSGNNDEYVGAITAGASGSYSYVVRFSLDAGTTVTYCDLDGAGSQPGLTFEADHLGVLTVTP